MIGRRPAPRWCGWTARASPAGRRRARSSGAHLHAVMAHRPARRPPAALRVRCAATSTPSVSRPRMTTCSTSSRSTPCRVSTANSAELTPGRSGPVTVINTDTFVGVPDPCRIARSATGAVSSIGRGLELACAATSCRVPADVGLGAHPVHHVRVVQLERRPLRTDPGQLGEVVPRRRATGGPLQRVAVAPRDRRRSPARRSASS